MNLRDTLFIQISAERERQFSKWGHNRNNQSDFVWSAILTEECGEVARECLEQVYTPFVRSTDLKQELIQVAAVAVAWLEAIHEREGYDDETDL